MHPGTLSELSNIEVNTFLSNLFKLESKPVVLHAYSKYCVIFVPTFQPPGRAKFPNAPRDFYLKIF